MASSKKQLLPDLRQDFLSFLQRHISSGSRVLLGFSGGLDSRVLLDLLVQASRLKSPCNPDFSLSVLHVNHGISQNAGAWADFCRHTCEEVQIPFSTAEVFVSRDSGVGLEAAARAARYAALMGQPVDYIMLAHHQDDQAETLLLQLLRGAGAKGLAAMGVCRVEGEQRILRPLLDVPRKVLLEYAQEQNLQWIEDESNLDISYDRNFLRHRILPVLETRFPSSHQTLARSAAHLAEAAGLLEELAASDAAELIEDNKLGLQGLAQFSFPRAKNLLRYWLAQYGINTLTSVRLEEVLRQLLEAGSDAQVCFRLLAGSEYYELRRYRDHAWMVAPHASLPKDFVMRWHDEDSLVLDQVGKLLMQRVIGAGVCLRKLADRGMTVSLRQGGEHFQPDGKRPSRILKNLLQESGVPPWQRECLPLLYCGAELVAIPGIGVASAWQAAADGEGILPMWIPN